MSDIEHTPVIFVTVKNDAADPVEIAFPLREPVWQPLDPGETGRFPLFPAELAGDCLSFSCRIRGLEFAYLIDFISETSQGSVSLSLHGLTDRNNLSYQCEAHLL